MAEQTAFTAAKGGRVNVCQNVSVERQNSAEFCRRKGGDYRTGRQNFSCTQSSFS